MGPLKIKTQACELLEQDPYDLITLEQPPLLQAAKARVGLGSAALIGVAIALALTLFVFWHTHREQDQLEVTPFAYFELRVIDPAGRPVAGALVRDSERQLGVTDSFGEWRRFMKVTLGQTTSITITKKTNHGDVSVTKNIAIPQALPAKGELELGGSVQLGGPSSRALAQQGTSERANKQRSAVSTPSAPVLEKVEEAAPAAEASTNDFNSIWFVIEAADSKGKLDHVVMALRQRSRELGLRVDPASAWQLRLRHLPLSRSETGAEGGLLQVEADLRQDSGRTAKLFSFLRNYQDLPLKTARDVLWMTALHTPKNYQATVKNGLWSVESGGLALWALSAGRQLYDSGGRFFTVSEAQTLQLSSDEGSDSPCGLPMQPGASCQLASMAVPKAAPYAGWQRHSLRVTGEITSDTDIYVSGFATTRRADGTLEFWGQPASGANVAVVRSGRLVYRTRLETAEPNETAFLALPSASLSRR